MEIQKVCQTHGHRAIKYRIYPNEEQRILLFRTFGCTRFIWNRMLADEQEFYASTDTHFIPTPAKYKGTFPWLKEVDSLALANAQLDLQGAFSAFFAGRSGYPHFKSRHKGQMAYTTNNQGGTVALVEKGLKLPKLGAVKAKIHRLPAPGWKLKSATVSQAPSGKYYCSVLFEYEVKPVPTLTPGRENTLGLDYSSPHFYVDSQGASADMLHFYRDAEERLARAQRRLCRMVKGSNNYRKQRAKVARIHERIANMRKDFTHQLSRRIVNSYDFVCVEDINLRGMAGSLKLGKATNDNGFGMFRTMLDYKLAEKGGSLIAIDKWFPSSKTCHECGYIYKELTLSDRTWACPGCGARHDRDTNAARKIRDVGIAQLACATKTA